MMAKYVNKTGVILVNTKQREEDLRLLPADEFNRRYGEELKAASMRHVADYDRKFHAFTTLTPAELKSQYVRGAIDLEELEAKLSSAIDNEGRREEGMGVRPEYGLGPVEVVMGMLMMCLLVAILLSWLVA